MRRVTIDEDRFINLLRKEDAYFELMSTILKNQEVSKAYGNHGKVVATHTSYELDDDELTEHVDKFMKIMEEF